MIEPASRGAVLLRDIEAARLETEQVALWWLGQSGYAVKTRSLLWFVDLYLSEHLTTKYAGTDKPHVRMTEAPVRGADIAHAEWVFASHKHSDHLDPGTLPALFAASPRARLVLPEALLDYAADTLGLERARLVGTRGDQTFTCGPLTVHSLPSSHPGLDYDEATGYPFLGFVFQVDGLTLYHSGDTVVYDGLAERLARFQPDVTLLPINGTDARRERLKVPPNMSMGDAVALARAAGARLLVPHHYDMFTFNTADVADFVPLAEAAGQPYAVLRPGERFVWSRAAQS
jgi:L-ascorbate metabolism protein UlaG (beta-lactamase superfamily)